MGKGHDRGGHRRLWPGPGEGRGRGFRTQRDELHAKIGQLTIVTENPDDIRIKRLLDEIYLVDPAWDRRLVTVLKRDHGVEINRKRLQRLRREIGHEAIWCKPRTSIPDDGYRKYPYLLRNLANTRPDLVWCTDITYVPMPQGHACLCAVMDWASRKVLGWAASKNGNRPLFWHWKTRWRQAVAFGRFSTPTRAASSPLRSGPGNCSISESRSAWMAAGAGWTTSSSSGCGGA
jgi:hypothetical protein